MTNIRRLPLLAFAVATLSNEDWTDSVVFLDNTAQVCVLGAIATPGSGYTNGPVTLTVIGGTGTSTQIGAVAINGQIAALTGLVQPGLYGLPPATTNVPVSGGGGTGCLLNLQFLGSPIDLTGITFRSTLRTPSGSTPNAPLDCSTANGLLINGGSTGALGYAVSAAQMASLPAGQYVTDIVASDVSGIFAVIAQIAITHQQGVTR